MVRREAADEYRRMNLDDQSAFRQWLVINTVVGAISLFALIAIASIFSGRESRSVTMPGHPQQNGRHERMHLNLKKEATRPGLNCLQQQDPLRRPENSMRLTGSAAQRFDRQTQGLTAVSRQSRDENLFARRREFRLL
jgi:hypothetical protein